MKKRTTILLRFPIEKCESKICRNTFTFKRMHASVKTQEYIPDVQKIRFVECGMRNGLYCYQTTPGPVSRDTRSTVSRQERRCVVQRYARGISRLHKSPSTLPVSQLPDCQRPDICHYLPTCSAITPPSSFHKPSLRHRHLTDIHRYSFKRRRRSFNG